MPLCAPHSDLPAPLRLLLREHSIAQRLLDAVDRAAHQFAEEPGDGPHPALADLLQLAGQLIRLEPHRQREELVLFPRMERRGVTGQPLALRYDHAAQRNWEAELIGLAGEALTTGAPHLRLQLAKMASQVVDAAREHVFTEEEILFPTAVRLLDESDWQQIQLGFDQIGPCVLETAGLPLPALFDDSLGPDRSYG